MRTAHVAARTRAQGVAVITGGASGIGFALSTAAVSHGMCVMMADIQATAMETSALELKEMAHVRVPGSILLI